MHSLEEWAGHSVTSSSLPTPLKLEMQEKRRVWSSGSSSNPLHQPRASAHGSMTLLPKKRRYKSSSHAFAIKITTVLLKNERQKWIFLTTLTKLKLKEAPDSSALLIQAFLDVYDNCLLGNLFKFVCKQRVCTHLQPPRECVISEKHCSHSSLFSFSPHRKPIQGRSSYGSTCSRSQRHRPLQIKWPVLIVPKVVLK